MPLSAHEPDQRDDPSNPKIRIASSTASSRAGYNLSFIAASLRPDLMRIVADAYLEAGDWVRAKDQILSSNALQCRSAKSAIRFERELRVRLQTLTHDQLLLAAKATTEDRTAMAWLAACKHIPFAFDFAADVLREKLATHDLVLRPSDYEGYLENKSLSHPELTRLAVSSKYKVRQILLRMLTEAGLLVPGAAWGTLQRPALSPEVVRVITSDNPHWLAAFLFPDAEIPRRQAP